MVMNNMKKLAILLLIFLVGCTFIEKVYDIDLTIKPYPIQKNVETNLDFNITKEGNPVSLELNHERLVHIFSVRQDLEEFKHTHPEDFGEITAENKANAQFNIKNTFAENAKYAIVFEFTTAGKTLYKQLELNVGVPKELPVDKDTSWVKSFDGYGIELIPLDSIAPFTEASGPIVQKQSEIKAGEKTALLFRVIKDGDFVDDLDTYLDSAAHFAIWKEDLSQFMHEHAYMQSSENGGHQGKVNTGPNLPVELIFPEPGFYKIFVQFKHKGKIITGDFWVEAKE